MCEGLIEYSNTKKCGVISYDGTEVIPCLYDYITLSGDYIIAAAKDSSTSPSMDVDVYDKKGSLQRSGKINFISAYNGLIMITDDTGAKYGLMDIRFEEVIPAVWDELNILDNGLFIVYHEGKYGVIDYQGKEVIPVKYSSPGYCYGGSDLNSIFFSGTAEDGVYIFDQDGKQVFFSDNFTYASFQNGMIIAQDKGDMSHYINWEGEDIIPPAQSMYVDYSGFVLCNNADTFTCYTKDGVKLPLPESNTISIISPERFMFVTKGNWLYGICGADGGIIVPAEYTFLYPCYDNNDLIIFSVSDKSGKPRCGIIDLDDGRTVLDGFDMLQYAGNDLFYASKGAVYGLVDINGSWIWQTSDYQTLMD